MRLRQTLLCISILGLVAAACGDDDDDATTDTTAVAAPVEDTDADDADDSALDDEDEEAALCRRYDTFVDDPSPGNARDFLENHEDSMPTGVLGTVTDVADGLDVELDNVIGYFGPVCDGPPADDPVIADDPPPADEGFGEDGFVDEFEGTTDTEEDRAAAGEPPVSLQGACLGLFDAWSDDDRDAAARFGEAEVIDDLFTRTFSPPAGSGVRFSDFGDCFYEIPSGVAEISLADSDIAAFVIEVTWYDSDEFFSDPDRRERFESAS